MAGVLPLNCQSITFFDFRIVYVCIKVLDRYQSLSMFWKSMKENTRWWWMRLLQNP